MRERERFANTSTTTSHAARACGALGHSVHSSPPMEMDIMRRVINGENNIIAAKIVKDLERMNVFSRVGGLLNQAADGAKKLSEAVLGPTAPPDER